MNLHEFYQKHYFFEMERKQHLTRELTLPVGLVVILSGALFAIARNIGEQKGAWDEVLIIAIGFSFLSLIAAIVQLTKSYYYNQHGYSYIATPQEWKKRLDDLEQHYSQNGGDEQDALDYLEEEIGSEYANSAGINTYNNDIKSGHLHKAKGFLIASVILVMLSGLIYAVNYSLLYKPIESQILMSDSKN